MSNQPSMAQVTIKAIVLGIVLAIVLAGANAYLGLFAGMTVSASIPAAVISMGILRLFRSHTILENNIVQTTASAGEAVAAGVIFTMPALYLLGYWDTFDYWWVTAIAGIGGVLGVLFSVPLRRALIIEQKLPFPEGMATAEVLRSGASGGGGVKYLAGAALAGGFAKFCETGLRLWSGTAEGAAYIGRSVGYVGTNVSPALLSVGFIIGLNIAIVVFSGGAFAWYVLVPIYSAMPSLDPNLAAFAATNPDAIDFGYLIWDTKIRYVGVGAMLIGGVWSLIAMRGSLVASIRSATHAGKLKAGEGAVPDTERDMPLSWIVIGSILMVIPIYALYHNIVASAGVAAAMAVIMVVAGFVFSAVSSYMAGLVGSSNNPTSGMTIATLLFAALVLAALLGRDAANGAAAAVMIGAVVCVAAAIGGDNLQDLKAGYLVGATPWKQQIMLVVGAVASALVMAPILNLLLQAYGLGPATADTPNSLTAPQATLMASVASGVFGGGLPWGMVGLGVFVGAVVIALDKWLEHRGSTFRVPVLAAAIGIYLPLELLTPILFGGILAHLVSRWNARHGNPGSRATNLRNGTLFAAGLITGEALIGIIMAIPIVLSGERDVVAIADSPFGGFPGLAVVALLAWLLYRAATRREAT
ncbi:MAG TPA: oligopeptide transporter, OPT family [Gammaproteobacteria bacterium]